MDNKDVQNEFMKWYLPQLKQYEVGGVTMWSREEPKIRDLGKVMCQQCFMQYSGIKQYCRDAKYVALKVGKVHKGRRDSNEVVGLCALHAVDRHVYEKLPTTYEEVNEAKDEFAKSNELLLLQVEEEKLQKEIAELRAKIEALQGTTMSDSIEHFTCFCAACGGDASFDYYGARPVIDKIICELCSNARPDIVLQRIKDHEQVSSK
jgi:hypothetical protein